MKYLIALLIVTSMFAKSKIVNGKLVLDTRSECRKDIDHARDTFRRHSGDYYSVTQLGRSSLQFLPKFCVDRDDSKDLSQLQAEIEFAMKDVKKHSFRPGHVGPKQ